MTDIPAEPKATDEAKVTPAGNTDGRGKWDWNSRYGDAAKEIKLEAKLVGGYLVVWSLLAVLDFAAFNDLTWLDANGQPLILLKRHDTLVFLVGSLGSTIFAIKWLVHSVANGTWHLDRRLWRVFVPLTGGIYALVVLGLMQAGFMGGGKDVEPENQLTRDLVIAFLAGYFSDGVSGLLTNIANAIFGKVDHK